MVTSVGSIATPKGLFGGTRAAVLTLLLPQPDARGNLVCFQADSTCPFFNELRGLILKTSGIAATLRSALGPVHDRIKIAAIFGSAARGTLRADSDVDLLIISDHLKLKDLSGPLGLAGRAIDREIYVNLYRSKEWSDRALENHPLAVSILNDPKIVLVGDEDELE